MANVFVTSTGVWVCDTGGELMTSATSPVVMSVLFKSAAPAQSLIISSAKNKDLISLESNTYDRNPFVPFEGGRKTDGLRVDTIDGGTAYIYLAKR